MTNPAQIIGISIIQALQELRVNKLRTFLSLLGITIGIFCIISVLTALDSARGAIQKNVSTLGSDVLYIGRWPWPGQEDGEYKWWEYWTRPSLSLREERAVNTQLKDVAFASLCLPVGQLTVKYDNQEVSKMRAYCVNPNFEKIQNIELGDGRYFNPSELEGGNSLVVLGSEIYNSLFVNGGNAVGKSISLLGRKFIVIGVMKKVGQNMADFDFDNSVIIPYNNVSELVDVHSLDYNPRLMVKTYNGKNATEVKEEVRGILRSDHRLRPGQADNFVINQLSGLSASLNKMFDRIDIVGFFIGFFSLLVGAFGIANIMYVTVKERTKVIGLKKAIGAKRSSILLEFLSESVVLCLVGGLIGIFLVLGISLAVRFGTGLEVALSLKNFFFGVMVSVVVGVVSGFVPARKASRMDPVVAIRSN